jgi:hypothetical protein
MEALSTLVLGLWRVADGTLRLGFGIDVVLRTLLVVRGVKEIGAAGHEFRRASFPVKRIFEPFL